MNKPTEKEYDLRTRGMESFARKRSRETSGDFDDVRRSIQAMETTFITIHDLTRDARILYCSHSVTDILQWSPQDITGKPCWDFFHPDEVPFARNIHTRGVQLDRASVLNYCRIKNKHGEWVGCECVFTIVYNVLIGCTSIYLDGPKAKKRAVEAPIVRQLFSSSPRDPRYHMLTEISRKFREGPLPHLHEPRAALFLNRFTRTLTINFATDGLADLLGISASELQGESFYYCIQENCLHEAVRCLESAKANDSIAYLRFFYRDPRLDNTERYDEVFEGVFDTTMSEKSGSLVDGLSSDDRNHQIESSEAEYDDEEEDEDDDDDEDGGVRLTTNNQPSNSQESISNHRTGETTRNTSLRPVYEGVATSSEESPSGSRQSPTRNSAQESSHRMFDHNSSHHSSTPRTAMSLDSPPISPPGQDAGTTDNFGAFANNESTAAIMNSSTLQGMPDHSIEIEAIISCTSDGLVVVLRAARPFLPNSVRVPSQQPIPQYENGLFASPWATKPVFPPEIFPAHITTNEQSVQTSQFTTNHDIKVTPNPITPRSPTSAKPPISSPEQIQNTPSSGPPLSQVMASIRDVAVFAWALTGINGSLAPYARGKPLVGAVPHNGVPVWSRDGESHGTEEITREGYAQGKKNPGVSEQEINEESAAAR